MIHTYKSKQDENKKRKNGSSRASNGSKHGSGGEEDGEGGEGEGEQVAKVAPGFRIPLFCLECDREIQPMRWKDPSICSDADIPGWAEEPAEPCCAQTVEAGGQPTRGVVARGGRARVRGNGRVLKFWIVVVQIHLPGVAGRHIIGRAGPEKSRLDYWVVCPMFSCFDALCTVSTCKALPRPFPEGR